MKDVYNIDDLRDWREPELRFAVFGNPVAHSASPAMHNAALKHLGLSQRYCRLYILPEELQEAVSLLPKAGFRGVNLTIPHKTEILPLLDEIDDHAKRLGAVNTVAIREGKLIGRNTDGPGIVLAIQEEFGKKLGDLRVLILGAGGGAGRAISTQCALEGCPKIFLMNRTPEKARLLAENLGDSAQALAWNHQTLIATLPEVDLILNTSSLGMKTGDLSPVSSELLHPGHLVYDTIYVGKRTPLQIAAERAGAKSANGLSLLLHQGVLALEFWLGRDVSVQVMRDALWQYTDANR